MSALMNNILLCMYGAIQHSIATYLGLNLFADILGLMHSLNNVMVEMEHIYKVSMYTTYG